MKTIGSVIFTDQDTGNELEMLIQKSESGEIVGVLTDNHHYPAWDCTNVGRAKHSSAR